MTAAFQVREGAFPPDLEQGAGRGDAYGFLFLCREQAVLRQNAPQHGDDFPGTELAERQNRLPAYPPILVPDGFQESGGGSRIADIAQGGAKISNEIPLGVVQLADQYRYGFPS